MSLEDLEKELYGQKNAQRTRVIKPQKEESSTGQSAQFSPAPKNPWSNTKDDVLSQTSDAIARKTSKAGKSLLVTLIIVICGLLALAGYYLYQFFTTKDVQISASMPQEVNVGIPTMVSVMFLNESDQKLVSPKISLSIPEGVQFTADPTKRIDTFDAPAISPGETIKKDFEIIITGSAFQTYTFEAVGSYGYEASTLSSRFEKKTTVGVAAKDAAFTYDVVVPEQIMNGEEFEIQVRYQNLSDRSLQKASLEFTFPNEFIFTGSDVEMENKRLLSVTNLDPHEEGMVIVTGYVMGKEYSYLQAGVKASVIYGSQSFVVGEKNESLSIVPSPLRISIATSQLDAIPYPGQPISYTFSYENNSEIVMQDVIAEVQLTGEGYNFNSLETNGSVQERTHTIRWTASEIPEFKNLEPGKSGTASFRITIKSGSFSSNKLELTARITSPTVAPNVAAKKTVGVAQFQHTIGGGVTFTQMAYHQEPLSDIVNTGDLPPRVGEKIQYTIHWKIGASRTDMKNIEIKAALSQNIDWTGKLKIIGGQQSPTYNPRTREIVWSVPSLAQGSSIELVFQIETIPPSNTLGRSFRLVGDAVLQATDTATNKQLNVTAHTRSSMDLVEGGSGTYGIVTE